MGKIIRFISIILEDGTYLLFDVMEILLQGQLHLLFEVLKILENILTNATL